MRTRYVVLGTPKDLIVVSSSVNYFYESEINYFVFIGSHEILRGPALEVAFMYYFC